MYQLNESQKYLMKCLVLFLFNRCCMFVLRSLEVFYIERKAGMSVVIAIMEYGKWYRKYRITNGFSSYGFYKSGSRTPEKFTNSQYHSFTFRSAVIMSNMSDKSSDTCSMNGDLNFSNR